MSTNETSATRPLSDVAGLALEEARRQGATQCEVDASVNQGLSVSVRLGEVDTVEYQRDRGLGVTVYFGKRKGAASTADLTPAAVRETVAKACASQERASSMAPSGVTSQGWSRSRSGISRARASGSTRPA